MYEKKKTCTKSEKIESIQIHSEKVIERKIMLPSSLTGYNHLIKVIEDKGEPPRHKDM